MLCFKTFLHLVVLRVVPDFVVRLGIRYLLSLRLEEVCSPFQFILDDKYRCTNMNGVSVRANHAHFIAGKTPDGVGAEQQDAFRGRTEDDAHSDRNRDCK
jgi:hypothetical protein